jgi:CelD/BcsL family acetyltransferase involved in cellulose biosynthesis
MVEVIEGLDGFARLAPQWNALLRASQADCPFLTQEWLEAWWRHLGASRRLQLVSVRDHDELIAIAPLFVAPGPLGMFSRFEFLGTGYAGSDYLDVIVRRGRERESLQALAGAIRTRKYALRLTHLPATSLASRLAGSLAEDGWTVRAAEGGLCAVVPLAGHSWDSYLRSLGASHRANVRRRQRALAAQFKVQFQAVTTQPALQEALTALKAFHAWRFGTRGSTAFLTPGLREFHHDATARALAAGWLRMYVLRLDDAPAAVMYGFLYNHRFYFYQHGFDAQYEPFSVGLVLMTLTLRAAIEEGAVEFDMLYGTEKYKALWATEYRPLVQLQIFPPHLGGSLHRRTVEANRSMRTLARRLLSIGGARAT